MPATGVLATLVSPEGRRDETLAALRRLQAASDQEAGTTLFSINEHRDAPGTFSVFERYEDEDAVAAHRGSSDMHAFREALLALGLRPTLTFMDPIDPG